MAFSLLSILFGETKKGYGELFFLPKEEIERIVSPIRVRSLTNEEEHEIEQALHKAKVLNGKITLKRVDTALRTLEKNGRISRIDRSTIYRAIESYKHSHESV